MKFELPPLPYSYDALEPYISARALEFHYNKHHRGYLDKLERVIGGTARRFESLQNIILNSTDPVYHNAAQLWNHTFYWHSLTPGGGGQPEGPLAEAIDRDFESFDVMRQQLAEAAMGEFGGGWVWLVAEQNGKLKILSGGDAENPIRYRDPLLAIDVWEHAYYLDYQFERGRYVDAVLTHLINWPFAQRRFERRQRRKLESNSFS